MNNNTTELSKLKGITFESLNIRSLTRKIDDIKTFLHHSELDYLALNETWLNNSIADCQLNIDTFHRFDQDLGNTVTQ